MKVILYSTHCAHCRTLTMLLNKKNIKYEEIYINPDDPQAIQIMLDLGFKGAPGLLVDDRAMDYSTAVQWVKEQ